MKYTNIKLFYTKLYTDIDISNGTFHRRDITDLYSDTFDFH